MTVTTQYAAEHLEELAAAAFEGSAVYIKDAKGKFLELRSVDEDTLNELPLIDENGNRKLGFLPAPMTWEEWQAVERDWDENVIPNLWMNRDDLE